MAEGNRSVDALLRLFRSREVKKENLSDCYKTDCFLAQSCGPCIKENPNQNVWMYGKGRYQKDI